MATTDSNLDVGHFLFCSLVQRLFSLSACLHPGSLLGASLSYLTPGLLSFRVKLPNRKRKYWGPWEDGFTNLNCLSHLCKDLSSNLWHPRFTKKHSKYADTSLNLSAGESETGRLWDSLVRQYNCLGECQVQ